MKYSNLSLIAALALTLTGASVHADELTPNQVAGVAEQSIFYGSNNCGSALNLRGINFPQAYAAADQDAAVKCQGNVRRVSDYQMAPSCYTSSVWGTTTLSVKVSANYECL